MHYYQFNIGDYASHTRHLTLIEDIAYRRLLDLYYLHERPLNAGLTSVARQINMRDNEAEIEVVLNEYFQLTADGWINKRADDEIVKYNAKLEQASKAGKASAAKRTFNDRSTDVQPNNKHKPLTNNQEPVLKPKAQATPLPDWLPSDAWSDFLAHRKAMKATMTPRAQTIAINELTVLRQNGHDPGAVIRQSIMRGWKGLFGINQQNGNGQQRGQSYHERLAETAAALTGRAKPKPNDFDSARVIDGETTRLD